MIAKVSFGLKASFLESFKIKYTLAGLLTYPCFEPSSHIKRSSDKGVVKTLQ